MKVNEKLSVLFLLERSKMSKDGKVPIWVRITVEGSPRAEFSLGIKLLPGDWDQQTERVNLKGSTGSTQARQINSVIIQALADVTRHYSILENHYEWITSEMVKKAYKGLLPGEKTGKEQKKERTLCQACNYKYSQFAALVKSNDRSENTLKRWRTTKRKIREFLYYKFKKWDLPLSGIRFGHAKDFWHFLLTRQGLDENTASKYLKNIREVLQIAENNEWIAKNPWEGYKIKYVQPERECLTMQEIIKLYQKPLIERLDHVRNIFLFACFTGYAFQEVLDFTKKDIFIGIDGKRWIKINRRKTKNPECIPLLPIPASVVDRYATDPYCIANNKLLPVKSYHNYNSYLKEVAYLCEISIELSTHIARHTFATTICLDNDVPIETVSRLLGHTNIRTTQIYAKVSKKKISNNMSELESKLFTPEGCLITEATPTIPFSGELTIVR